jgi:hypothetical protein
MSKHYVYKYVLDGKPIYVGITSGKDVYGRLKQHGRSGDNIARAGWDELRKSKIFFYEVPDRNVADALETAMIREYMPKYNKAKTEYKWDGIPISYDSLKWEEADLDVVWNNKLMQKTTLQKLSNVPQESNVINHRMEKMRAVICGTEEDLGYMAPLVHAAYRAITGTNIEKCKMWAQVNFWGWYLKPDVFALANFTCDFLCYFVEKYRLQMSDAMIKIPEMAFLAGFKKNMDENGALLVGNNDRLRYNDAKAVVKALSKILMDHAIDVETDKVALQTLKRDLREKYDDMCELVLKG